MNAPTSPTKLAAGCESPAVKNQTGSAGSCVTSAMSQMSETRKQRHARKLAGPS